MTMNIEQEKAQLARDAKSMLDILGIESHLFDGTILVNRTSMCKFHSSIPTNSFDYEGQAYKEVLDFLQANFEGWKLFWSGRTDEVLGVEFHKVG